MKISQAFDLKLYEKLLDSGYKSIKAKEEDQVVLIAIYVFGKAAEHAVSQKNLREKLCNRIGLYQDLCEALQKRSQFLENWLMEKKSVLSIEKLSQSLRKEKWMTGALFFQDFLPPAPNEFGIDYHVKNQSKGMSLLYGWIDQECRNLSIEEKYILQRVLWSGALIENFEKITYWQLIVDWAQFDGRRNIPEELASLYRHIYPSFHPPSPDQNESDFIHDTFQKYTVKRAIRSLEKRLDLEFTQQIFEALAEEMESENIYQEFAHLPHFEERLMQLPSENRSDWIRYFQYFFSLQNCCGNSYERSILFDYIAKCKMGHQQMKPYQFFFPTALPSELPSMSAILPVVDALSQKFSDNTHYLVGLFLQKPELLNELPEWPVKCLTVDQLLFFCSKQDFVDAYKLSFEFGISFGSKGGNPFFELFSEEEKRFLFAVSTEANFQNRLEFLSNLPLEKEIHDFAFAFLLSTIGLKDKREELARAIIERDITRAVNSISIYFTSEYEINIGSLLFDYLGFSPQESVQN